MSFGFGTEPPVCGNICTIKKWHLHLCRVRVIFTYRSSSHILLVHANVCVFNSRYRDNRSRRFGKGCLLDQLRA